MLVCSHRGIHCKWMSSRVIENTWPWRNASLLLTSLRRFPQCQDNNLTFFSCSGRQSCLHRGCLSSIQCSWWNAWNLHVLLILLRIISVLISLAVNGSWVPLVVRVCTKCSLPSRTRQRLHIAPLLSALGLGRKQLLLLEKPR